MKSCNAPKSQPTRRIMPIARSAAIAVAFTISLPHSAVANKESHVTPPPVPANIQVPAGNKAFREGHAVGTQAYICLPSASGYAWTLFGPQATLFNDHDKQVITHFISLNPLEGGTARATWQHSEDTSSVWGQAIATSSDSAFVAPSAIPWLLLQVVGDQAGPTGGHKLTATTFIQRLNTSGGVAPSTGCSQSTDVGARAFVPYAADYFFYR